MKEKNKLDLVKIKNSCASKDTIKKVGEKKKNIEWEKILQIIYLTRDSIST